MATRTREVVKTVEIDADKLDLRYTIADESATPPGSLRCNVAWNEDGQRVTKHVIVHDEAVDRFDAEGVQVIPDDVVICRVTTAELAALMAAHRKVQAAAFDAEELGIAAR